MADAAHFEQELTRGPDAPREARRALSQRYGPRLEGEELYRAKLLASELVTNAVIHGKGRIVLRGELDADRLLVEVTDEGSGFEHQIRRRGFEDQGGRGLAIVEAESSRWGIHEGTTHVWFEVERGGRGLGESEDDGPRLGEERKPAG